MLVLSDLTRQPARRLQAFCRVAAVAGATYVLRHAVAAVLVDAASGECVGVRTVAGQTLRCGALAADVASLREMLRRRADDSKDDGMDDVEQAPGVARAVCITDASLQVNPHGASQSAPSTLLLTCSAIVRCCSLKNPEFTGLMIVLLCQQEGTSQLFAVMPPRALPTSDDESVVRVLQVSSAPTC